MTSPMIEVIVTAHGEVRVETKGFTGTSCHDASRFLEEALGTAAIARRTAEYYEQETAPQRLQQGSGP